MKKIIHNHIGKLYQVAALQLNQTPCRQMEVKNNFRKLVLRFFFIFWATTMFSQNVVISNSCVVGNQSLVNGGDTNLTTVNSRPVYYNAAVSINYNEIIQNTQCYLYYALAAEIGTAENRWVIAYDGQPYYYNISDATTAPTNTYLPFDTVAPTGLCGGNITVAPACTNPVITGNPPNRAICSGNNTTFSITATGATSYQWQVNTGSGFTNISNVAPYSNVTTSTLTITGAVAGMSGNTYRCGAIDSTCSTNSNSATLTISNILTTGSQTNVSCLGGSNGTATVVPSGGISGYSYSWSPSGGTGATASGLTAGTYTVTVTDNILCSTTRTYTISQPAAAVSGTTVVTNVACNGGTNGAINITPSGGTGPYTFNWGGGVTTEDRTGLAAGTYSVIITDVNGCTGTVSGITVSQPAAVSATTVVTNVNCNGGTNGAINITPSGGTGPYTFNWGGGITTEDRIGLAAGTYSVIITDNNGCTGTVSGITVSQPAAVSGTTVVTNINCNGGTNGAINLTPTGGTGPYTFNWGGGITTEDRTGLAAGTYSVIITDFNGCTRTVSGITVSQPAAVSGTTVVTNVACNGGTNGAINITPSGGTSPYTFNWGGGITTEDRTGLASGTYSIIITDVNGCTGTVSGITVSQPAAAVSGTTVVTSVACNGGTNGTINLTPSGGTSPYTFNWGGGVTTEDRTGLTAGTYSVIITDVNGCTGTVSGNTVTQPSAISTATGSQTNVSCNDGTNGTATVSPSGGTPGYTYSWSPSGGTDATATGLAAGSYTVTVTDANGCTATRNYTITEPSPINTESGSQTNVSCNGGTNGSASVSPSGGTPGYTYSWSPSGGTAATATDLAAGTYTVTVTDANSCTATRSFTITQPSFFEIGGHGLTNVSCNGGSNGYAIVSVRGGTSPYTYSWAPSGGTEADASGLTAGTYTVTATDANSCTVTESITITEPDAINTESGSQTNVSCNGGTNGSASVSPSGGTPGYTYSWSPSGGTEATATGLAAGSYTVTITDANSCTATRNYTITEPSPINTESGSQTNVSCNDGTNGSASVSPSGGTPGYTYSWSPSGGTDATATGLAVGSYTVTVTDANGCTATRNYTITEPSPINTGSGSQTNVSCFGGTNGSASVSPSGGTPGYTYSWSPSGGTDATATGLAAGSYTVTVTDANGCTAIRNYVITQPEVVAAPSASAAQSFCGSASTASLTVTGNEIKWYDDATNGTLLVNTTALVNGNTYYASQTINGCEGLRTAVTVTITPNTTTTTVKTATGSYTWSVNGTEYTQSGSYNVVDGCHTEILNLTIIPFTKIQNSQCGATLAAFDNVIIANTVSGIQGYKFEVSENNIVIGTAQTTLSYFRISQIAGANYNRTYSVRVTTLFNGVYGDYGDACLITTPTVPQLTKVQATQCGATLAALDTSIIADVIPNVQGYKFEVSLNNTVIGTVQSATRYFKLSQITGTTYNKTYSVKVSTLVNGVYGAYGDACSVTSPATAPLTNVQASQCGITLATFDTAVYANTILGVQGYKFEVSLNNTVIGTVQSASRTFKFTQIAGATYNKTYSVRVATLINGVYEAYGDACSVTTPATAPLTKVQASQCGTTLTTFETLIYANSIVGVQGYKFEVSLNNTVIGTLQTTSPSFKLTQIAGTTYNKTYSVRVATLANSVYGDYGDACSVTTPTVPLTKIQPAICGATLAGFDNVIIANTVTGVQGYKFEVSLNNTVIGTLQTTSSYFRITQIAGTTYNKTYSVRVATLLNGVYGDYGDACSVTTPATPALTKVQATQCGTTLAAWDTDVIADVIPNVQGYKFEVSLNNTVIGTVQSATRYFKFSQLAGAAYNKTYSVRVTTLANGIYGEYGEACLVATTPLTKIQPSQCGTTLPVFDNAIIATTVNGVQGYKFEVSLNNTVIGTVETTLSYFRISQIAGATYNKTYSVRVTTMLNGVYRAYGEACTITTPAVPLLTKVQTAQCGATLAALNTDIIADVITNVQGYKFEVSLNNTVIGTVQSTTRYFKLTQLAGGTSNNKTYSIRVCTLVNGQYGAYGDACNVSTPCTTCKTAKETVVNTTEKTVETTTMVVEPMTVYLKAYPNPFMNVFKIAYTPTTLENVIINVYDITGRQVESRSVKTTEMDNQEIGNQYPAGIYQVTISQGNNIRNIRVSKN